MSHQLLSNRCYLGCKIDTGLYFLSPTDRLQVLQLRFSSASVTSIHSTHVPCKPNVSEESS